MAFFPDNGAAFVGRGSAIIPPSRLMIASPPQAASVSFSSASASAGGFLSEEMIAKLAKNDWVEIRDFISPELVSELRGDVEALRNRDGRFKQAGVGQDATNTLNTKIRRAETCFIYPKQPIADAGQPQSRQKLYDLLDGVGERLSEHSALGPNAPSFPRAVHIHIPGSGGRPPIIVPTALTELPGVACVAGMHYRFDGALSKERWRIMLHFARAGQPITYAGLDVRFLWPVQRSKGRANPLSNR